MARTNWIGESLIGRYRVDELLGQGGMAAVYKATDLQLNRVVAIKIIHPHLSGDTGFLSRFKDEASQVAQLRHEHIPQVYDFSDDNGSYFMVMEFIPGETLQNRLARLNSSGARMSVNEALEIIASVSDATHYAHMRGLIHRDIKPANVMLSVYGQSILMDFGIARITGSQRHTATGAVVGTASYMSPEQIRGEPLAPSSDVYTLGVMLFEMISGRPPFKADSAMTLMMMHVNDPVPDISQLRPEVPALLVQMIERALSKKPQDRFQSAAEIASAARKILSNLDSADQAGKTVIEQPVPDLPSDAATFVEMTPPQVTPETPSWPPPLPVTSVEEPIAGGFGTRPAPAGTNVDQPGTRPAIKKAGGDGSDPGLPAQPGYGSGAPLNHGRPSNGSRKSIFSRGPVLLAAGTVAILMLICFAGAAVAIPMILQSMGGSGSNPPIAATGLSPTVLIPVTGLLTATPSPTPSVVETAQPAATTAYPPTQVQPTLTPSQTPEPSLTPTATVPPGLYVRINRITIQNGVYIVEYETFEYTEILPGMHVHFFYNTVPPEQAGVPGSGPWILYGGPRPFDKYTVSSRPAGATQMCALVANQDHSIQLNTGNCVDLPSE